MTLDRSQNSTVSPFDCRIWSFDRIENPTATLPVRIIDADAVTDELVGLVERNGIFWMEDLPLGAGMISIDDSATDAAGNVNTTGFNVVQSGLTLDHLWSASIEGAINSGLGTADAVVKPS